MLLLSLTLGVGASFTASRGGSEWH